MTPSAPAEPHVQEDAIILQQPHLGPESRGTDIASKQLFATRRQVALYADEALHNMENGLLPVGRRSSSAGLLAAATLHVLAGCSSPSPPGGRRPPRPRAV